MHIYRSERTLRVIHFRHMRWMSFHVISVSCFNLYLTVTMCTVVSLSYETRSTEASRHRVWPLAKTSSVEFTLSYKWLKPSSIYCHVCYCTSSPANACIYSVFNYMFRSSCSFFFSFHHTTVLVSRINIAHNYCLLLGPGTVL